LDTEASGARPLPPFPRPPTTLDTEVSGPRPLPPPPAPPTNLDTDAGTAAGSAAPPAAEALNALPDEPPGARLDCYRRELALEVDPGRRAVLEHEIGRLLELVERDPRAAEQAYDRALDADPGLKPNLWALRRLGERRGDFRRLATLVAVEAG